jgi:hypothetical protein
MDLGPKAEMREIRTSGLMSGIWKRNTMSVTAPDLDSTKPKRWWDFRAKEAARYEDGLRFRQNRLCSFFHGL